MFEGYNGNVITYGSVGISLQQFKYVRTTRAIVNPNTEHALAIDSKSSNVIAIDNDGDPATRFEI